MTAAAPLNVLIFWMRERVAVPLPFPTRRSRPAFVVRRIWRCRVRDLGSVNSYGVSMPKSQFSLSGFWNCLSLSRKREQGLNWSRSPTAGSILVPGDKSIRPIRRRRVKMRLGEDYWGMRAAIKCVDFFVIKTEAIRNFSEFNRG
jgi:hypothetical protein